MRYARLHSQAAENPEIGELLETNPLAVSLYFLALVRCDLYGVLPAEPRRFRAAVAPAAILPHTTVAQTLDDLESHGLVVRYADRDGAPLLQIVNFHKYQQVRWANGVGPPEHDLPDCWVPPDEFMDWVTSDKCLLWAKQSARWWEIRERYCSATVVLQLRNRCATLNKTQDAVHREHLRQQQPAAADAPTAVDDEEGDEPLLELQHQTTKPPRKETVQQQAIRAAWDSHNLGDLPKSPKGYAGLTTLVSKHGAPIVHEWAVYVAANPEPLPEAADPWAWFATRFREAMARQFTWRGNGQQPRGQPGRFILRKDGTRLDFRDWDEHQKATVAQYKSAGMWDDERGMATNDARHPSRQQQPTPPAS